MEPALVRYSKFLSRILRHKPGLIGLALDGSGWARVDDLLAGMNAKGLPIDRALLERVVAENDKQRFAFSPGGEKIRASQGHSMPVELGLQPRIPPALLYHGTAKRSLPSIRERGLLKGRRQAVHLSTDPHTAEKVGRRHGEPVVLIVETGKMAEDGFAFTCSENGVWLVEHVPEGYIRFPGEPG